MEVPVRIQDARCRCEGAVVNIEHGFVFLFCACLCGRFAIEGQHAKLHHQAELLPALHGLTHHTSSVRAIRDAEQREAGI